MSFVFILDSLRVGRLAGDVKPEEAYTVATVTGQERKRPLSPTSFSRSKTS